MIVNLFNRCTCKDSPAPVLVLVLVLVPVLVLSDTSGADLDEAAKHHYNSWPSS